MLRRLLMLPLVVVLLAAGWLAWFALAPLALPQVPFAFEVLPGSSVKTVARNLSAAGLLREPWSLVMLVRLTGKAGEVKAGNYLLEQPPTGLELYRMLTRGEVRPSEIRFIEGWTFRQLRQALDAHPALRHETTGLSDAEVLSRLAIDAPHPEGLFFPDTYYFGAGVSDLSILRRAHAVLEMHLSREWERRDPGLPYRTPYEALIMASIIEKETGAAAERPLVAGVFVNRLRLGMRLQTDPTVIYGLGERFDGNLRRGHLQDDGPYNTYMRAGLPPTPICSPGLEAIRAALHPAPTRALYFVSRGDGTHAFSATLEDHNRAVARYQLR
ncbi:endolytic transglycosylase MltG [Thiobacter aerophilum]|uniref:Endolytic murein transglycosylase n=1 Tax=Thiobacter aerophilum TaxID=3121275 RepID=A0ABV0EDS5_9BURK